VEWVPFANAGQYLENQIAELVSSAHVGLAGFLIHEAADEFLFVGVGCLQEVLVLIQKLADRWVRVSQVTLAQEPFQPRRRGVSLIMARASDGFTVCRLP
jgi:hypothetical protein